ncbi:hypothetical protein RRG08_010782 [Elysia crispata]|uniref:Uncharacterized protein n=1 Tax=Elysia crispata TaxID=231223 RepID=A0AAE1A9V8_9GAST|nr:hypothetical protein RRG08_010782 [Elysia crispata]
MTAGSADNRDKTLNMDFRHVAGVSFRNLTNLFNTKHFKFTDGHRNRGYNNGDFRKRDVAFEKLRNTH